MLSMIAVACGGSTEEVVEEVALKMSMITKITQHLKKFKKEDSLSVEFLLVRLDLQK
jgi:hypothetical protein